MISAFNALSLSPPSARCCCAPRGEPGAGGAFFSAGSTGDSDGRPPATSGVAGLDPQKRGRRRDLAAFAVGAVLWRLGICRARFCRTRIGLLLCAAPTAQIRPPCSAPRPRPIEWKKFLKATPGVQKYTSVIGFSLLSTVYSTYNSFFFVTFKPWSERTKPDESYDAIKTQSQRRAGQRFPEGTAFAFAPPAIPGVGTAGGVTFVLEDRAGKDVAFLGENVNKFVDAGAQSARSWRASAPPSSPPFRRSSSTSTGRSAQAGREPARSLPDAAVLHGRNLRQLFQPLRPPMAGVRRGRGRIPGPARAPGGLLRPQSRRRDGPPLHFGPRSSSASAPNSPCATICSGALRST